MVCIKEKEKSETCNKPLNDCVGLADRQKKIKCHYDRKQYYVDTASVTPTTFAVVVLGVSSQSEGDYVCRPLSVESGDLSPCQLNVAGLLVLTDDNSDCNNDNRMSMAVMVRVTMQL